MFLYYELFEQFMQHLHSEARYQTNKITNIFHRETLCMSPYYKVYQPIPSKYQPNLRSYDVIRHNSLKKWLRIAFQEMFANYKYEDGIKRILAKQIQ